MMISGFEGKVVIVTGVSTGTGAATTRDFPVRRFGRVLQGILPLLMLPLLLLVPQMVWAHAIVLKSTPAFDAVPRATTCRSVCVSTAESIVPARK